MDKKLKKNIFSITNINIKNILFLVCLLILLSLSEVLSLALIYPFIDFVINGYDDFIIKYNLDNLINLDQDIFSRTLILGGILILTFLIKFILSVLMRWKISSFIWYRLSHLQQNLLKSYQLMDYEYFTYKGRPELVNNLKETTRTIIQSLEGWLKLIGEVVIYVSILIYLITVNFKYVIFLSLIVTIIFCIYYFFFRRKIIKLGEENLEGEKYFFSAIDENIKGFKEIKVFQKEKFFIDKVKDGTEIVANSNVKSEVISLFPRFMLEFLTIVSFVILVLITLKSGTSTSQILPAIGVFSLAALRIVPGVNLIITSLQKINYGRYALEKLNKDFEKANDLKISTINLDEKINNSKINFQNLKIKDLTFKYQQGAESIFQNMNIEILKRDCIGIVGESGSGKTTFIDLLLGLLTPENGKIFIDDVQIKNYKNLYNLVSYLPQEPVILESSISKNISLENDISKIYPKRIEDSLKFAELYNFVNSLPNKEKTLIGENGINLSGGQKQRLVLARNYYFDREIIILDEATSALDIKTQTNILKNIELLKNKKTLIIITHRLETLKNCNKIYRIKDKKLILDE